MLNQHIVTEERVSHGVAAVYPVVKQEYCVMDRRCVNCISICPERAITAVKREDDPLRKTAFIEPELCTRCGLCYQVCPTNAIEDVNAIDYRTKASEVAGKGMLIVFSCEHHPPLNPLPSREGKIPSPLAGEGQGEGQSAIISVPDLSIISWRDIFKIMATGSPVLMIGCDECRQTNHFKQIEEIFANSCYEGAFSFYDSAEEIPLPADIANTDQILDENILEQIIFSYTDKIYFPGTAWVDIGDRCTLCQNCSNLCPTEALTIKKDNGKISLIYDHNLCKGCPVCEKACPERCIAIDRRLRLNKLAAIDVKCESSMVFCKMCNKPISTDAAFERIKNILYAHGQKTEQLEYCPDCKGSQLIGITN
ncbi:MAG: 4Fe-4S dicluster domain-containing protein [Deltaproteobacteria bacterium]|nr:4Fe-4S dicluster domain-containing protein [Deltaproteobacteria bacterium]